MTADKSDAKTGKKRVHLEQVKNRHTNHWDLDMLSREELDRLMTGDEAPASPQPAAAAKAKQPSD